MKMTMTKSLIDEEEEEEEDDDEVLDRSQCTIHI